MEKAKLTKWCYDVLEAKDVEKHNFLNELTVIIPSYKRQDFLIRQIAYWGKSEAQLIIVDGSPESLSSAILDMLKTLPNIRYLHNPVDVFDRLKLAAQLIKTEFTVLQGDDEFLLKSGLSKAIQQMHSDPSLSACIGQTLGFFLNENKTDVKYGETAYLFWKYNILQENVSDRLQKLMSTYNAATSYAVQRSAVWIQSWAAIQKWTSPYASEMKQAMSTLIAGKLASVEDIYWLRSNENNPISIVGFNRDISFEQWWKSPLYKAEKDSFIGMLVTEISERNDMTADDSRNLVLESVAAFLKLDQENDNDKKSKLSFWIRLRVHLAKLIRFMLPEGFYIFLKSLLVKRLTLSQGGGLGSIQDLRIQNSKLFSFNEKTYFELQKIESLLVGFYGNKD